jgi:hypothetical protein
MVRHIEVRAALEPAVALVSGPNSKWCKWDGEECMRVRVEAVCRTVTCQ